MPFIVGRKIHEGTTIIVPPSTEPTTIKVKVSDYDRGKMKLAFECPREVKILRDELLTPIPVDIGGEA